MSDLEFLIQSVKDGKVPGLTYKHTMFGESILEDATQVSFNPSGSQDHTGGFDDWLCAAIRRALTKMGWIRNLSVRQLSIVRNVPIRTMPKHFKEGTELEQHLAAIRYVIEQSEVTK